ncbi:MAG: tRNA pseudouridine(55) synthase TruB [Moraxellaceae bacterium]|nr:tRNA pseudouridine(55) synthase TruB [Moraxellaceae bacterium]
MSQKQTVSGVILIDKPQEITSQQVVSKVKYLFMSPNHNSKKAGHTGTLDPMATGLLPVCLGEATKFSHYQLNADKSYQAIIKLGEQTDTGDADGEIIATKEIPPITSEKLAEIRQQFLGDILQTPPMYSALKKDGKKLYEYAREGIEIERPLRPISIKNLTLDLVNSQEIQLMVTCSKGTYVRVLGEDIAKSLETLGHLTALRRIGVDDFKVKNAISLADLEKLEFADRFSHLLAIDVCLTDLEKISLDDEQVKRIGHGQRLNVHDLLNVAWFQTDDKIDIRLYDEKNNFIGLAILEKNGRLQPKKLVKI